MRAALRILWVLTILIVTTFVLLPFHLVALVYKDQVSRVTPRIWHLIARWALGIKIKYRGKISKQRPLMLVANHSSWLDIVTLGSSAAVVFIAKSEVRDWPILGTLAKLQHTIFIDRNRRLSTGDQVSAIADRMKNGDIVVLFPEGTTSDGNFLMPFKSALFGAVQRAQIELPNHELIIQPVSVAYVSAHGIPLGRGGRDLAAWPGDVGLLPHLYHVLVEGSLGVEITYGEPIVFDDGMKRSEIAKMSENAIRESLYRSLR